MDDHALAPFLATRLSDVGLDSETYAPYVLPLLLDDDDTTDADEWESVLELLRASSETHSDNEQVWLDLKRDIEWAWKQHKQNVAEADRAQKCRNKQLLQAEIERERELAREAMALEEEREKMGDCRITSTDTTTTTGKAPPHTDDEARRALVARFAYENEDDEEDAEEEPVMTNRQVAAQASLDKAQELRKQKVTTKKEEQQKTSQARQEKVLKKEERKKRTTKGERRR